jgi:hypothetical protein
MGEVNCKFNLAVFPELVYRENVPPTLPELTSYEDLDLLIVYRQTRHYTAQYDTLASPVPPKAEV